MKKFITILSILAIFTIFGFVNTEKAEAANINITLGLGMGGYGMNGFGYQGYFGGYYGYGGGYNNYFAQPYFYPQQNMPYTMTPYPEYFYFR